MKNATPWITMSALLGPVILAIGCTMPDPPEPEAGTFEWATYENGTVGFVLEFPNTYRAETQEGGYSVLFRTDRGVPVKVYWTTEEESKGHGLWFGKTPIGEISLARHAGHLYEYTHCDGPLCSTMKSYVVPLRGRYLALEFRSAGRLHDVNRRILDSFQIGAPATG